jgi:protein N-terminal glutamine amidohydrolase
MIDFIEEQMKRHPEPEWKGQLEKRRDCAPMKQARYWPFFCEENVWHLCSDREAIEGPVEGRRVVFVSNARKRVAMRHQRAGRGGDVVWDYHVVLLAEGRLWDLDTTLGFGIAPAVWLAESFVAGPLEPRFRVIDAPSYLASFASDRSHMIGADGRPLQPLPPWPPIGKGMNLMRFVDMVEPFLGEVTDAPGLHRHF